MSWKDMVVMDEQALRRRAFKGIISHQLDMLCAHRKMLKTFEVMRRKMGINDPTALLPPPPPSGVPVPSLASMLGSSASSSGGMPSV
ncbi:hypothetical protein V8E53_011529 [Lactarius tabidus]